MASSAVTASVAVSAVCDLISMLLCLLCNSSAMLIISEGVVKAIANKEAVDFLNHKSFIAFMDF